MCQPTSLPEAFGRAERAISEVMHPLLVRRSSLLPAQLFMASPMIERLYRDRPIVVHSEVGITAADGHIPV